MDGYAPPFLRGLFNKERLTNIFASGSRGRAVSYSSNGLRALIASLDELLTERGDELSEAWIETANSFLSRDYLYRPKQVLSVGVVEEFKAFTP